MKEKVIILGAGIAGLTAGIHLLEKGYDVTILEKNKEVGGLCFGYFVNGHYIDGCLHWLMGTNRKSALHKEWTHIGALGKGVKVIGLPKLATFEYQGTTVTFYRDLDKTEQELCAISPEDRRAIHRFIGSARDMGSIMGLVLKNKKLEPESLLRSLPHSAHIFRCMRESRDEYATRFKHPAIQFAFRNAQTGYNNMFFFLDFYGLFSTGNADVPEGGAFYMVQRIKQRYLDLGGKLQTETTISKLETKDRRIASVITDKGDFQGNYYISTIDPQYTLKTLLGGKHRMWLYDHLESTVRKRSISSCFNVYITVDADITHIDVPTILNTKPMKIGANKVNAMLVRPYHFDPKHFIKDGKTVVSLFIDQNEVDYAYYKSLPEDKYLEVAKKTAETMIDAFKKRYPDLASKIELLDYFGPLELQKQTNTGFGSIQSYSFTDRGMFYVHNGKMKDLDNLFFCGQWTRAIGGTPTALLTASEMSKQLKRRKRRDSILSVFPLKLIRKS